VVIGSSRLICEGRHLLSRLDVFSLLFDVPLVGLFQVLVLEEIFGDLVGFAAGRYLDGLAFLFDASEGSLWFFEFVGRRHR